VLRRRDKFVAKCMPPAEILSVSVLCSRAPEFRRETLSPILRLKRRAASFYRFHGRQLLKNKGKPRAKMIETCSLRRGDNH